MKSHLHIENYLTNLHAELAIENPVPSNAFAENPGEIFLESVTKLLNSISITQEDVFFDLGSSLGKVVLQVFLQTRVKESHGIEFQDNLHQKACFTMQSAMRDFPNAFTKDRKLNFVCADFLKYSFETATIVFINSICFSHEISIALSRLINQYANIRHVFTMRSLVKPVHLTFQKSIPVECSWDSSLCYLYSKNF